MTERAIETRSLASAPTLAGRVALVTGGTAYIGRAIALELARRGARVVVNGRNPEAGAAVVREIAATGASAEFEQADLTDADAVHTMVDGVANRHGRLDILVASGGGASADSPEFRFFMDIDRDYVDHCIRAYWLTRASTIHAAATVMRRRRYGKIIALGSDAGRVATVGESIMGGAVSGLMQMCRALAREFGRDGIRVNTLAMSYIWDAVPRFGSGSPGLAGSDGKGVLENLRKRMLFPVHCQDIANAAAFLAGPESDAITGQTLSVNGGLSTPG